jgi:hypothetical protein
LEEDIKYDSAKTQAAACRVYEINKVDKCCHDKDGKEKNITVYPKQGQNAPAKIN